MSLILVGAIGVDCENNKLPALKGKQEAQSALYSGGCLLICGQWVTFRHQEVKVISSMHHSTVSYYSQ